MNSGPVVDTAPRPSALPLTRSMWLLALAALWLVMLGMRSLISADEGRYASISLAMVQSGDWLVPRLNGLLYFEKPPLQYWAGALAMALLGPSEFAARLWPGACGLATVALLGHGARRLWGERAGWIALVVGGCTTWIVVNSQFLSLDAGLTATLTLVLCGTLIAQDAGTDATARRRWLQAAWLGIALAVLSKGLVGIVIPGAAIVLRALWQRDWRFWRGLEWRTGPLILLAVAAPWFVAVSLRQPEFARFFFIHEHVERFLTPVHRREGPWWTFVPVLLVGLLPWTAALPSLLRPKDGAERLLLCWAAFVFVFFSLSSSKLPSYVLPMFPALVLLVARRLHDADARTLARLLVLPAAVWAVVLVGAPFAARWANAQTPPAAMTALGWGFGTGAAVFLAGAAFAWFALRQGRRDAALAAIAAGHLLALFCAIASHDSYGQLKSSAMLSRAIAADTPVFAVRSYDQTLPFYLRRSVTLVDVVDEFQFGEGIEPERWIPTLDAFAERWQQLPQAAAYLSPETLPALKAHGVEGRIVYEDPRRIVIAKP